MPISNRTPPKDLARSNAITENTLRKASDGIEGTAGFKFTDDEKAVLAKAQDVLLDARIRSEFPIVGRVLKDLVGRIEGGEKLEWTPAQTRGFLDLVGELSFAENDTLNKLRDLGVIPEQQWDTFVKPHKDATNEAQSGLGRKAKWGLASFGTMGATIAIGYGVVIATGGPVGALLALGATTAFGLTVGKKAQEKIGAAAYVENAKLGVNETQGQEVRSEAILLASRAALGDVLTDKTGTLLERLRSEEALGDIVVKARQASGDDIQPLEQPFVDMAAQYLEGIGPIADKLEQGKITETEARKQIMEMRGNVLSAPRLDAVAQVALSTYVNHPEGQKLVFLRQLSATSDELLDHLKKNGGKADATMRGEAAAMIQIYHTTQGELGTLSLDALQALATVANGLPVDAKGMKTLAEQVALPAKNLAAELEPKLKATEDTAIKQARLAFDVLWGTVVPSFNEIKDQPVAKGFSTRPLPDGGFEVTGKFKGGMLKFLGLGSEGNFKVKVDDTGQVDAKSLMVDLGPKFAKHAGKKALETWTKMVGVHAGVHGVAVDDRRTADGRYMVRGAVGDMTGKVEVSSMGMVAWDTLKVG